MTGETSEGSAAAAGPEQKPEVGGPAEEAQLGGTPGGRAANAALLALSRASRSFLLYDPLNEAIRSFISDLRHKMYEAFVLTGPLALEVRPFEMVLDSEVVYLERDRERSLAFRMFRDGVRRLTIQPDVEWEELMALLEVLSIRYTGVRQSEDDTVTLLWKAGFKNIEIDAVEGFIPEDDEQEGVQGVSRKAGMRVDTPPDWDLPLRPLPGPVPVQWQAVPEQVLEALRAEEASQMLPANAVRAVAQLLEVAADPASPMSFGSLSHLVEEVRDFLLSEGQLETLVSLVRALQGALPSDPETIGPMIAAFGDRRAITKILHSTPTTATEAPRELLELLDLLPADHLGHFVDLLGEERAAASRRLTRQLIERYAPASPDYVLSRVREAEPAVALDLLRVCGRVLGERATEVALDLAARPDLALALEALRVLDSAPGHEGFSRKLAPLLDAPLEEVRLGAIGLIGRHPDRSSFSPLVRFVKRSASSRLTEAEAEAAGRTLAQLSPAASQAVFKGWIPEKGLLGRLIETREQRMLQWAAVAGLGQLPGEGSEAMIRRAAARAGAELKRHCEATLAARRRELATRG